MSWSHPPQPSASQGRGQTSPGDARTTGPKHGRRRVGAAPVCRRKVRLWATYDTSLRHAWPFYMVVVAMLLLNAASPARATSTRYRTTQAIGGGAAGGAPDAAHVGAPVDATPVLPAPGPLPAHVVPKSFLPRTARLHGDFLVAQYRRIHAGQRLTGREMAEVVRRNTRFNENILRHWRQVEERAPRSKEVAAALAAAKAAARATPLADGAGEASPAMVASSSSPAPSSILPPSSAGGVRRSAARRAPQLPLDEYTYVLAEMARARGHAHVTGFKKDASAEQLHGDAARRRRFADAQQWLEQRRRGLPLTRYRATRAAWLERVGGDEAGFHALLERKMARIRFTERQREAQRPRRHDISAPRRQQQQPLEADARKPRRPPGAVGGPPSLAIGPAAANGRELQDGSAMARPSDSSARMRTRPPSGRAKSRPTSPTSSSSSSSSLSPSSPSPTTSSPSWPGSEYGKTTTPTSPSSAPWRRLAAGALPAHGGGLGWPPAPSVPLATTWADRRRRSASRTSAGRVAPMRGPPPPVSVPTQARRKRSRRVAVGSDGEEGGSTEGAVGGGE